MFIFGFFYSWRDIYRCCLFFCILDAIYRKIKKLIENNKIIKNATLVRICLLWFSSKQLMDWTFLQQSHSRRDVIFDFSYISIRIWNIFLVICLKNSAKTWVTLTVAWDGRLSAVYPKKSAKKLSFVQKDRKKRNKFKKGEEIQKETESDKVYLKIKFIFVHCIFDRKLFRSH